MTVKSKPVVTVTTPSDRELVITAVVDAPRALVFEACTKPEHVKHWWGPRRMTMSTRKAEGLAYFLAFIACIPAANWMIGHLGTVCTPGGPCLPLRGCCGGGCSAPMSGDVITWAA